jgi:hypothetical protein
MHHLFEQLWQNRKNQPDAHRIEPDGHKNNAKGSVHNGVQYLPRGSGIGRILGRRFSGAKSVFQQCQKALANGGGKMFGLAQCVAKSDTPAIQDDAGNQSGNGIVLRRRGAQRACY